jgi:hypothetical protein
MADEQAENAAEGDVTDKAADTSAQDAGNTAADAGKEAADDSASAANADADASKDGEAEAEDAKGSAIPENWRDLAADGDDDLLKELKRYGSLKGVAKALKEAKATIRAGVKEPAMPDPKDDRAMSEWRKAKGIPDDPTGYQLPETVTKRMTDADKPLIASFTEYAHAKHAPPAVVQIASEWYFDSLEAMEAERIAADKQASEVAEESLRETWGNAEFKGNLTLASRFVEAIPGVGKGWAEARLPDGRRIGDIAEFMEWASDQGRATFGDVTFATSDSEARHNNRKAELEQILKTDSARYWREGLDKEYGEILQKEEKRRK